MKNKRLQFIIITFLLIFSGFYPAGRQVLAQDSVSFEQESHVNKERSLIQNILKDSSKIQRELRQRIVELTRTFKKQSQPHYYVFIILLSFFYGVIHSMGPGHSKVIIFSYFLSVQAKKRDGVVLGILTAFIHGFSGFIAAALITLGIDQICKKYYPALNTDDVIPFISGLFVIAIGCFLFAQARDSIKQKPSGDHLKINNEGQSFKQLLITACGIGIVPCAGTIILVSFFMAMKRVDLSVVSSLAMSMGMACTIVLAGVISILSRQTLQMVCGKKIQIISVFFRFVGVFLLIILGITLILPMVK